MGCRRLHRDREPRRARSLQPRAHCEGESILDALSARCVVCWPREFRNGERALFVLWDGRSKNLMCCGKSGEIVNEDKLEAFVNRCCDEGRLVDAVIRTMAWKGCDPVVDVERAVATLRSWNDLEWAQLAVLNGMAPLPRVSREEVVALLRATAMDMRRERERS